jgi:hypothetical protein
MARESAMVETSVRSGGAVALRWSGVVLVVAAIAMASVWLFQGAFGAVLWASSLAVAAVGLLGLAVSAPRPDTTIGRWLVRGGLMATLGVLLGGVLWFTPGVIAVLPAAAQAPVAAVAGLVALVGACAATIGVARSGAVGTHLLIGIATLGLVSALLVADVVFSQQPSGESMFLIGFSINAAVAILGVLCVLAASAQPAEVARRAEAPVAA